MILHSIKKLNTCRCRAILILFAIPNCILAADIVLDVDHSTNGSSTVVSASCEREYTYNLALGQYIIAHSNSTDNVSVEMKISKKKSLNKTDPYLLHMRKDLLIAIHHGTVQKEYIKKNSFGCPTSSRGTGFSIFLSKNNPHFTKSLSYAKVLGTALLEQGLYPSLHHTEKIKGENKETVDVRLGIYIDNDLKILNNTNVPSLLLEAGIIVNPKDDIDVRSDVYKSKISKAILDLK